MADTPFDILIRTTADTKGAEETAKALGKVKQGQVDFGKTASQLEQNVRPLTAEMNRLAFSKKQVLDVAKGLSVQFPLVGSALRLLANPLTGMIAVLAAILALFIKLKNEAARLAEDVDFTPMRNTMAGLADTTSLANDEMEKFGATVQRNAELQREANQEADATVALIKAEAEAEEKLAAALGTTNEEKEARARVLRDKLLDEEERQLKLRERERDEASTATVGLFKARSTAEATLQQGKLNLSDTEREIKALEEKRKAGGLRPDESARLSQLYKLKFGQELDVAGAQSAFTAADSAYNAGRSREAGFDADIAGRRARIATGRAVAGRTDELGARAAAVSGIVGDFYNTQGQMQVLGGGNSMADLNRVNGLVAQLAASKMQLSQLITLLANIFADGIVTKGEFAALEQAIKNQRRN